MATHITLATNMEKSLFETQELSINSFHMLKNKWTMWAHLPHDTDWTQKSYKKIYTVSSVEETIAITDTLPKELVQKCMLFLMKDGIMPMWEDPGNSNGGYWSFKVSRKNSNDVWKKLTAGFVGNSLTDDSKNMNCITGISISPKISNCVMKIWNNNYKITDLTIFTKEIDYLEPNTIRYNKHN